MGAVKTQSRFTDGFIQRKCILETRDFLMDEKAVSRTERNAFHTGTGFPNPGMITTAPRQTTTSYRSGRAGEHEPDPTPGELFKRANDSGRTGGYDNGHEFSTVRQDVIVLNDYYITGTNGQYGRPGSYRGPLVPRMPGSTEGNWVWPSASVDDGLVFKGTKAINATIPTNPLASLAVTIGELRREGLPNLIGAQTLRNRGRNIEQSLGSEHLNVEFGWKPLISDVQKTATALARAEQRFQQLLRDSGRNVRRRYTFPIEESSKVTYDGSGSLLNPVAQASFNGLFDNGGTMSGHLRVTESFRRESWFSGAYTYHYEPDRSFSGRIGKFQRKWLHPVGLELTPSTFWNLTPWSWFSDWTNNSGTILANAEAFSRDGLVLRYGYIMSTTVADVSATLTGIRSDGGKPLGPITLHLRQTRKQRVRATPFGFGLTPTSFSSRQWSILAALGMTKGSRQVRQGD